MNAEILRQVDVTGEDPVTGNNSTTSGTWVGSQDPITGAILNEWRPEVIPDNPDTPYTETVSTINCLARGIVDGGIRVAGTTERFGDTYENIDYVKLWTPTSVRLSKRDQVTNIRDKRNGTIIWLDEEYEDGDRPTIFNVNGVTPLFDAFNRHVENFVLLEKYNGGR
jgi:hypothetical protein